uniref:snRNA-activating protein complex subunit 1 isoform X2 n=1 Tax=Myxine glutinosa TaxID=7769 RepID=UPI00358F74FC
MAGAAGARSDCERLLDRFCQSQSVRFEDFSAAWRDMNFSLIFYGRAEDREQKVFTEELLHVASRFLLPSYNFQVRVGALYLLYGLYSTQLCNPPRKIRIALSEWRHISKLCSELNEQKHSDAEYVMHKLRREHAFHLTALPVPLIFCIGKNSKMSKLKEQMDKIGELNVDTNRVFSAITSEALEEIQDTHDHYHQLKCAVSSNKDQPDRSLALIKEDLIQQLHTVIESYNSWKCSRQDSCRSFLGVVDKECDKTQEEKAEEGLSRAEKIAAIKNKSYTGRIVQPRSRRHRQSDTESKGSSDEDCRRFTSPTRKAQEQQNSTVQSRAHEVIQQDVTMVPEPVELNRTFVTMPVIVEEPENPKDPPSKGKRRSNVVLR